MKANDLRIGNLVNASLKSGKGRIINHTITGFNIANMADGFTSFNFEPIPLTEDWLIKFGFEKVFGQLRIQITNSNSATWSNGILDLGDYLEIKCKYVHTLQNLFHSLTGKELTIKNNEQ